MFAQYQIPEFSSIHTLALILAILFFIIGIVVLKVFRLITTMVRDELSAQKIYFPKKDGKDFDPTIYPDLQQFAGQLVDTPKKAKAFANGFIGRHLKQVASGKTYYEVNAELIRDPDNQKLQRQKQILFQGETLRGLLLISGYGFGTLGKVAGIVMYTSFAISGVLLLFVIFNMVGIGGVL